MHGQNHIKSDGTIICLLYIEYAAMANSM